MSLENLKNKAAELSGKAADKIKFTTMVYGGSALLALGGGAALNALRDAPVKGFTADDGKRGWGFVNLKDKALYNVGGGALTLAAVLTSVGVLAQKVENEEKKKQAAQMAQMKMMERSNG